MTSTPSEISTRAAIDRLLRPASVAIVGASPNPTSLGASVLTNLESAGYRGGLYLVNPKHAEICGRPCLPSVEALPEGIDCAVLAVPRSSVLEATEACGRRGVGAVIIFSSGFAERGPDGLAEQEKLAGIARNYSMIVEGPNCLGMVNFVDRIPLTFVVTPPASFQGTKGIAIASQSGAMAAVVGVGLRNKGLGLSFSVSTGNEAVSEVEDYVDYFLENEQTKLVLMIVEQFRRPKYFLDLAARARALGKHIVLLHPGRSGAARLSAATHTGAMAGNYDVMLSKVSHAGVIVVNSLEELLDVSEILIRCPTLPSGGVAVLTESGAFKALALDFCEQLSLPLPLLGETTAVALCHVLPEFIPPTNPLDITAHALVDHALYGKTLPLILNDDRFGSVLLGIILTDEATGSVKFPPIIEAIESSKPAKPVLFAALDEGASISPAFVERLRALGVPFFPSPERAFRALASLTAYAAKESGHRSSGPLSRPVLDLPSGVIPEYRSKAILSAFGIRIPKGSLAQTVEEAQAIAADVGYPVALKAQSAKLSHKSDAGGVALNLADATALSAAWLRMYESIVDARGIALDGVLVEAMAVRGVELIVGARNDPDWGPVLLLGSGGVLAEAMRDVRLLSAELSVEGIVDEMLRLKGAALLRGFRGSPSADLFAAAEIVQRLAVIVLAAPNIREVDINPVVVYPEGQGAIALDALIVTH